MNPRIALIGAGYWGKNLVRNFNELGNLEIICDFNEDIRSKMKTLYPDVAVTGSIDDIFHNPNIDAVVISTPAETHYTLVKLFLEKGYDVFVEKPLSLQTTQGEELVDLANKNDKILFVGHILHYHSAVKKMKAMINQGIIGRIEYIYSNRLSLGKIRREENILWSFAPHDISLILSLIGEDPYFVDSVGNNFLHPTIADITMSNLKFSSGVGAHIFVSWLNPFKEQRLVVVGSQGMLVFEDTQPLSNKLMHYPHIINWKNGIPCPEKATGQAVDISEIWSEPLKEECKAFVHSIQTREKPFTSGEEGLRVLKVLESCQKSIENKQNLNKKPIIEHLHKNYFVHDSACVDEGVDIGENSKVWHFSHVMKGAKIGKNCILGQNVNVDGGTVIGNNVKIQNNVSIYTGVEIEDNVFLGPSCVLTNISNPRSEIKRHSLYEKTIFKKGSTIGANSTIVCGKTIGRYAFVAAGSVVTKDVPDYALVMGNPARQVSWVSRHGHPLKQGDEQDIFICPESQMKYQLKNDQLKCLDLDEEEKIPEHFKVGTVSYQNVKKQQKG